MADAEKEAMARRQVNNIINEVLTTEKAYFASLKCMVKDWCVRACSVGLLAGFLAWLAGSLCAPVAGLSSVSDCSGSASMSVRMHLPAAGCAEGSAGCVAASCVCEESNGSLTCAGDTPHRATQTCLRLLPLLPLRRFEPLAARVGLEEEVLTQPQLNVIFGNIHVIYSLHKILLKDLTTQVGWIRACIVECARAQAGRNEKQRKSKSRK